MKGSSQHNTNQKSVGPVIEGGGTKQTIVGSSIGSVAPIAKGMDVNNNSKAQPYGGLARGASSHMSPGHNGGVWSKRASAAKKSAATPRPGLRGAHTRPVNAARGALKRVKPD